MYPSIHLLFIWSSQHCYLCQMWAVVFAVAEKVFYSFPDVLCLCFLLHKPFEAENCIIFSDLLPQNLLTAWLKERLMDNRRRRRCKFDGWLGSQNLWSVQQLPLSIWVIEESCQSFPFLRTNKSVIINLISLYCDKCASRLCAGRWDWPSWARAGSQRGKGDLYIFWSPVSCSPLCAFVVFRGASHGNWRQITNPTTLSRRQFWWRFVPVLTGIFTDFFFPFQQNLIAIYQLQ